MGKTYLEVVYFLYLVFIASLSVQRAGGSLLEGFCHKILYLFINGLVYSFMKHAFIDGSLWALWKQQQAKQPLIYGPYFLVVETKKSSHK